MTALLFDTETNDKDEPEIIEAAGIFLDFGNPTTLDNNPFYGEDFSQRFRPSKPIKLGAMSTHHIMDEDLTECDASATFILPLSDFLIGHNVDFDWKAAGSPDVKRICTLAMARECWPELDCYTQSAMIYHLDRANARERLKAAHSASSDALLCKTILDAEIAASGKSSWEELWQFSEAARVPKIISFGKHKGTPIKELPRDYVSWLLRATDPPIDEYLRKALLTK